VDNKEIQKKRMMSYFIEAAKKLIEEEGIDAVTIRRVASMAGYNSATLYNYFENLNHLIFFASMKYLNEYAESLHSYTKHSRDSLERYVDVWRCFCLHSFSRPEIYNYIFFSEFSNEKLNVSIRTYYSIFPDELSKESRNIFPMLLEDDFNLRDYAYIKPAVAEGLIDEEAAHMVSEMCVLIYLGMFSGMLKKAKPYKVNEAVEKTIKYIKQAIRSYTDNYN